MIKFTVRNQKNKVLLKKNLNKRARWPLYRSPNWLNAFLVILVEKHPRIIPINISLNRTTGFKDKNAFKFFK